MKNITIVDYSEKAFAVIGEGTKEIKDTLKQMGGHWNRFLKVGPGWIFSKRRLAMLEEALGMKMEAPNKFVEEGDPFEHIPVAYGKENKAWSEIGYSGS